MRRLFFIVWFGLAIASLARAPRSAEAATIEGRVVDSDGKPLAGAEVRIWQKVRGANGRLADRPVEFEGRDVLLTDAKGRFVSPDVLLAAAPAHVVAEAAGMLAGRSGWIRIADDAAAAETPDITLKRLRIVIGRVVDHRGQPVDGATVFNSGDAHQRIEAKSKGGGKFLLANVPEGGVFLFAEKPGYRFTGMRLPPDQAQPTLVLTSLDEPADPKPTLPPLLSADEEYALARSVLDPWLDRLAKSGTPDQRIKGFSSLIQINGLEAFQRLDWLGDVDEPARAGFRDRAIRSIITDHDRISWDDLRAMIEAGDDEYHQAAELIQASDEMHDGAMDDERSVRLEWLESATVHARKIDDPTRRAQMSASAAERLFDLGEVARARQILADAENEAKPLFADGPAQYASLHLALAAAHEGADRAIDWLAKSGFYLTWHGGRVAAALLPDHPQRAAEAWKLVVEAIRKDQGRNGFEYRAAAEFCYRLALADLRLAEQVAADADEAILRFRETGAILLALAETQPAEARRRLAAMVREELPQLPTEEFRRLPLESAPAMAAWLLPVAERVDPDLCGELFWRSLALRLPRPRRDGFNNHAERSDIQLARLLGRYDRDIARALLEPLPPKDAARFIAAIYVDPRWAKSLLDTTDLLDRPPSVELGYHLRFYLVQALAVPLPDRWHWEGDSAGFWEPPARERPLPP